MVYRSMPEIVTFIDLGAKTRQDAEKRIHFLIAVETHFLLQFESRLYFLNITIYHLY